LFILDNAEVAMEAEDQILKPLEGPELILALVGPVGANLSLLCDVLRVELARVGYEAEIIRLSSLLQVFEQFQNLPSSPEDVRYHRHMDAGNEFRAKLERGDALALLAVSAIAEARERHSGSADRRASRVAYVLRSLKHPGEVETLRKIYGESLFVISAYSDREKRIEVLSRNFAKSYGEVQESMYRETAEKVVVRDEAEIYNDYGQKVRETFPLADVFLNTDNRSGLEKDTQRFVQILFSHPFHTPTRDEFGMFHA
jgi:hypothetical protein